MSGCEFELKFQVPEGERGALHAAATRGRSRTVRLQACYFDTPDEALAGAGIALRVRREGELWMQTAKATGDGLVERLEHNVALPEAASAPVPLPRLDLHADTAVGARIRTALAAGGHSPQQPPLQPCLSTDVQRIVREMRSGDARIELAYDCGELRAGDRRADICELEFELLDGPPAGLLELAARWCTRHSLWLDPLSKASRGQRLREGRVFDAPRKAMPVAIDPHGDGDALYRATLGACLAQILANAREVAAGSDDAGHVHQLRVGIRRLRTALRELARFAHPAPDPAWEPVLTDVFRALGRDRDAQLVRQSFQHRMQQAGGPPVAWAELPPDLVDVAGLVRSARFQAVLLGLMGASLPPAAPPAEEPLHAKGLRKALRRQLAALHRQIRRDAGRFEALDATRQHRLRKRLKRLRYLAEFVGALFDEKPVRKFSRHIEPAQDALGEHNDAATALAAYQALSEVDPRAFFAVGWLHGTHDARTRRSARALRKFSKQPVFW